MAIFANAGLNLDSILNRFHGAQIGFLAISSKTHQVVEEYHSNLSLNPASNVKLITTLAALDILHPEYRFKTEYLASAPIRNGVLEGDLIVRGYGDPTITSERLQAVAQYLKLLGINVVQGSVLLDESYFGDEDLPPGWESEKNGQKIYTALPSALSLNHNIVNIFIRPGEVGQNAWVIPESAVDYFEVVGNMKTGSRANKPRVGVRPSGRKTQIVVGGTIKKNVHYVEVRKKVYHPVLYFGAAWMHSLSQAGIEVHKGYKRVTQGFQIPTGQVLWVDHSPMLSQVVAEINKTSSNFMAEMLLKAIAGEVSIPAKYDVGLAQVSQFLENKVGFKKGSFVLANGSGLGPSNRFSARQFVTLLEYAQKDFELYPEFMASLGVAGAQGTLRRRMKQEPTLRSLRAKTGTLASASSLSGYVDTLGDDTLIFSILVQGKPKTMSKARSLEDRIGNSLARMQTESTPLFSTEDTRDSDEEEEFEEVSGG